MDCKWGLEGCMNFDRCYLCTTEGLHYKTKQKRKTHLAKRQAKITDRKGSGFEYDNHKSNKALLSGVTSRQTPNSGAGQIKGDEEIKGLIEIMEELKEQNKLLKGGNKSFSIQKEWLEKLRREATEANKEFWYLKGCFGETDNFGPFIVIEPDIIMSMVYTMVEDRKSKIIAEQKSDVAEKLRRLTDVQNTELLAKIDLLESKIKLFELTANHQ